ncbi:restriction endonuclease subunit S [Variovorax boronicumulans]|uniref:restriction endonuclease subunit S n=1 Tax=Variovorax boronicumulans TaxID=436515 RepID=UPI0036F2DDAC
MTQLVEVPQQDAFQQTEIGSIPADWSVQPLGSVATAVASGRSGSGSAQGGFPVHGSTGVIGYTEFPEYSGDAILVARVGANAGKLSLVSGRYGITDNTIQVRIGGGAVAAFVYRQLEAKRLNRFVFGSGQPLITGSQLKSLPLAFPSFEEQREIGTTLNDVDALLAGLDRLIAKKRDLKHATMQQLLTGRTRLPGFEGKWKIKRIGDLTDCTAGGTPSTGVSEYWGGSIRWMNSGEIHLKRVQEVEGRITEAGLHSSSAKLIPPKCVLVGLAGQGRTRGTVAMNLVELCTNQSIAAIFPSFEFVSDYLYYNLDFRYEELREMSTGGGGRGGLNLTIIKAIPIPLPSLEEQTAIASALSDADDELTTLEMRRDKTRALKQAMMHELLTGRIRLI